MMLNRKRLSSLLAIGALVAAMVPTTAQADNSVMSFSYTSLAGSYTPTSTTAGNFTAAATTSLGGGSLFTSGTASRILAPASAAHFVFAPPGNGPLSAFGSANFNLSLALSNIDRVNNTADSTGTLTVTDIDADTIVGDVTGSWVLINGQATFNGALSNIAITSDDSTFNGQFATSFSTVFPALTTLLGVVTNISGTTGDFFLTAFSDNSTLVQSQVIPAPGAALLGILGLGVVGWIRKRVR